MAIKYNKAYLTKCLSKGVRPKGMPFKHYEQFAKAEKKEAMSADDYDAMDEDDGEEEKTSPATGEVTKPGMKKGEDDETIAGGALSKALDAYDAVESALSTAGASRETFLQARFESGTISKAEKAELGAIWAQGEEGGAGAASGGTTLRKSVSDQLAEDPEVKPMIDASDFVKSLIDTIDASLGQVSDGLAQESNATRQLIKAQGGLIKAFVTDQIESRKLLNEQSEVIKALGARLGTIERSPAPRRAMGAHSPRDVRSRDMNKGATAVRDGAEADQLQKSQVNQGLRQLMVKADDRNDIRAKQQIALATARYETDGVLQPNIEAAIRQEIGALS